MYRFRIALTIALVVLPGCEDSTGPGGPDPEPAVAAGSFDPAAGSFVLDHFDIPVPGAAPVPVELVATNLQVDPEYGGVVLDVALRNLGDRPLHPPIIVWLADFLPSTVVVVNADLLRPVPVIDRWGFEYTRYLGADQILSPGESSQARRWRFYDPGIVAFSFSATIEAALEPPPAFIGGVVFEDLDLDGVHQRNEGPWLHGVLHLYGPDGSHRMAWCDEGGGFQFFVDDAGLYRLELESLVECVVCFTTPNPLQVLLTRGPDGYPESFAMAQFGAICGPCTPALDPR